MGYVYILTNPSFKEDWIKIGKTKNKVDVRSKGLDNTAIPLPFDIYATVETEKYEELEDTIHKTLTRLTDKRIRPNREFYNFKPAEALAQIRDICHLVDDAKIVCYYEEPKDSSETGVGNVKAYMGCWTELFKQIQSLAKDINPNFAEKEQKNYVVFNIEDEIVFSVEPFKSELKIWVNVKDEGKYNCNDVEYFTKGHHATGRYLYRITNGEQLLRLKEIIEQAIKQK